MVEQGSGVPYAGEDGDSPGEPVVGERFHRLTSDERRALQEKADAAGARVRELVRRDRSNSRKMAQELYDIERDRLHELYGYSTVVDYALELGVDRSPSQIRQMILIVKRVQERPLFRDAFERDVVGWTKFRAPLAEAERLGPTANEAELLDDAINLSNRKMEQKYRLARGEPDTTRLVVNLFPDDLAAWEDARREALRIDPLLKDSAIVGMLSRALVQDRAGDASRPGRARIVLHAAVPSDLVVAPGVKREQAAVDAVRAAKVVAAETQEGPVAVPPAQVEEALCNAEIEDVRCGPAARIATTVPLTTARHVHARDRGRCKAPRCRLRGYLHVHHQGGRRRVGHDRKKMMLLCPVHHRMVHENKIAIEPVDGGFMFTLTEGAAPEFVPLDDVAAVLAAGEVPPRVAS